MMSHGGQLPDLPSYGMLLLFTDPVREEGERNQLFCEIPGVSQEDLSGLGDDLLAEWSRDLLEAQERGKKLKVVEGSIFEGRGAEPGLRVAEDDPELRARRWIFCFFCQDSCDRPNWWARRSSFRMYIAFDVHRAWWSAP